MTGLKNTIVGAAITFSLIGLAAKYFWFTPPTTPLENFLMFLGAYAICKISVTLGTLAQDILNRQEKPE